MTEARNTSGARSDRDLEADANWPTLSCSKPDDEGFVNFGDVARARLGQQCQYASRYVNPRWAGEYQQLGDGLRIEGDAGNYHSLRIHADDVEEFVRRYRDARASFSL